MAEPRALSLCVCVPARNEADRLPRLLEALASQDWPGLIPVSLAINNNTDDSLAVLDMARRRHAGRLDLRIKVADFPPELAHAGSARRLAMDEGMETFSSLDHAILVSTDADTRPPADWLTNIAAAFARGADLVGGRIEIDTDEPLPPPVRRMRAAWDDYWAQVRAIEDSIDPRAWDPAPRHGDHTGASLAIRAQVYAACGGVPRLATGEDRALVLAAVAAGAWLVHPIDVYTRVSPRLAGRAEAGMASMMQSLFAAAETGELMLAPAFGHWRERAAWRRRLRTRPGGTSEIARHEPKLPPMPHDMLLALPL